MARNKGQFVFAANFEVKAAAALDPRVAVATKAELFVKDTWPHDGGDPYLYDGLVVGVVDEQAVYMLVDRTKYAEEAGWLRVDAGNAEQIDVIDNLESDRADAALSAKQGKAIKGMLEGKADLEDGKVKVSQLPDFVMGQMLFGGIINENGAVTPSANFEAKYPDFGRSVSEGDAAAYEGVYFIVGNDIVNATIVGVAGCNTGDWIISTGSAWAKIDNTDAVTSVAGLDGAISANALAGKLAEEGTLAKSEDVKGLLKDVQTDAYLSFTVNEETGKLEAVNTTQKFGEVVNNASTAKSLANENKASIDSMSIAIGNINLALNGNDDDTDDIPNQLGIVGRLEAVEELIGQPTDEDKTSTMLSRLNALEELVTGGESGEGEGDQTLLQKVNQNTLDITALETTVYGADNKSGLVKAVETLNGASTVVGSVDYKIEQAIEEAFAWEDVE